MQTTLYFIRHGEVFNPDGILYGRLPNYHLSEKGKNEIKKTAQFLKNKPITQIYASPLERAQETATILNEVLNLPRIYTSEQILEIQTSYQGTPYEGMDKTQDLVYTRPLSPTDETLPQIAERMLGFAKELIKKYPGEHIVACSHGDPLMALMGIIKGIPLKTEMLKHGVYIKHGEVFQITDTDGILRLDSVFIPELSK